MGDVREVILTDYEARHPSNRTSRVLSLSAVGPDLCLSIFEVDDLDRPRPDQKWTPVGNVLLDGADLCNAINTLAMSERWVRTEGGERRLPRPVRFSPALRDSEAGP